jgi:hypothetical protein
MVVSDNVRSFLVRASEGDPKWSVVGAKLREQAREQAVDGLAGFIWAFDFSLEAFPGQGSVAGEVFVPMLGYTDGSSYPPALATIEEEWLDAWAEAADVDGPIVAARLHDLLWVRRWGTEPHKNARAAWAAYMELANSQWESIYRAQCLVRALSLTRSLNDLSLEAKAVERAVGFVGACLEADEAMPGAPFQVLTALCELPRDRRPNEQDELLLAAEQAFGQDSFLFETIAQMKMAQTGDQAELARLRGDLVQRWLHVASGDKGLGRFTHLRHALELAELYGLSEASKDIRHQIQEASAGDDDFHEVAVEVNIPKADIDKYIVDIVGDDDWEAALTRLGGASPPSGNYEANRAAIEQQKAQHPLLFLITKTVYGPHGFPIQTIKDEDLHKKVALSEYERMGLEIGGLIFSRVLDKIMSDYGLPSADRLSAFFTSELIPAEIAERVGASITHYSKGDFDECAHVVCPRIEATLRTAFMKAGITVISMPVGETPGRVKSLGALMSEALQRDIFRDASRARCLYNLLCDPYGMNLRNSIAHGFITKVRRGEAALLIQAICYLRLLRVARSEPRDTSPPAAH